jgi:hypothetical protein
MKKIFTLFAAVSIGTFGFAQTVFQSNLSSWTGGGDPTDWMTTVRSNISSANVVEQTVSPVYGSSRASLINTSTSSHQRFATGAVTVVANTSYLIEMWVTAQNSGELRTGLYDVTNAAYATYNNYIDVSTVSAGNQVLVSQTIIAPANCTSAEFILSLKSTDPSTAGTPFFVGILVDSVAITATTTSGPTITKIFDIQFPANANGDSPLLGNTVTTRGVVTGIVKNGPARHSFFIQDSARAYNGIYVYQTNDSTIVMGDSVEVTGTVDEFSFGTATLPTELTQIGFPSNITVLNSGNTLPAPVSISTANANMEEWEGVLVNVTNAQCTSNSVGFGRWTLNDGSGAVDADDDIFFYHLTAVVGTSYDVTGIGHYFFDEYSILPRQFSDISVATSVNELNDVTVNVYPNPVVDILNFDLNINNVTVNIFDITGKTLKSITSASNAFNVDLGALGNGIYFYQVIDNNKNIVATSKFVVSK